MKYKLGDTVMITELSLSGRVKRIQIEESGIIYEVRYFWNAEAKSVWFYEDELIMKSDIKIDIKFEKSTPRPSSGVDGHGVTHYNH